VGEKKDKSFDFLGQLMRLLLEEMRGKVPWPLIGGGSSFL